VFGVSLFLCTVLTSLRLGGALHSSLVYWSNGYFLKLWHCWRFSYHIILLGTSSWEKGCAPFSAPSEPSYSTYRGSQTTTPFIPSVNYYVQTPVPSNLIWGAVLSVTSVSLYRSQHTQPSNPLTRSPLGES
jgi:hypothetical protein